MNIKIAVKALTSFSLIFILSAGAMAEEGSLFKKGPIVITSESLSADNKNKTALFEGSVIAKTQDTTLYSDKMNVFYSEDGKVSKIDCAGNVKLIKGERVVTSDNAVYLAEEEKIVFTGQPKAQEGGNVVTGSKITFLLKSDRSLIENSKVFLKSK